MKRSGIGIILIGLVFIASVACAEATHRTATVMEFEGTVEVKGADGVWAPAKEGMEIAQGGAIRTKSESMAVLNLDQTATVEVKANSDLALAELIANPADATQSTLLDLAMGEVLIKAKKLHSDKSRFEVKTPTSIVGVRGTTFSVAVEARE